MMASVPPPLIYFYSASSLPRYGFRSLHHATKNWPGRVILLTDANLTRRVRGLEVIDFQPWFDSQRFDQVLNSGTIDSTFRSGFWAKTLQRFFVLEQFMKLNQIPKAAHAELDVVLLGAEESLPKLDKRGQGIFIPWFPGKHAIGSFVYINDVVGLSRLVERALTPSYPNEMELLKQFLIESPGCAFGLPTADHLMSPDPAPLPEDSPLNLLTVEETGGVFDAARLGQWIFGIDPRNVRGAISWNHHIESPKSSLTRADMAPETLLLVSRASEVRISASATRVLNLHVHAKSLFRASNPTLRGLYIWLSERPFRTPIRLRLSLRRLSQSYSKKFLGRGYFLHKSSTRRTLL